MTRVLATGTFDLLHPGHLAYLRQAREHGEELFVIIARDDPSPKDIVIPEEQRRRMVEAFEPVDRAVLGSEEDMLRPVKEISPDVIALGPDQDWDGEALESKLEERGIDAEVVRMERYEECGLCSSSEIIRKVKDIYC